MEEAPVTLRGFQVLIILLKKINKNGKSLKFKI